MAEALKPDDHSNMANCLTTEAPTPRTLDAPIFNTGSSPRTDSVEGSNTKKREGEPLGEEPSKRKKREVSPEAAAGKDMITKLEAEQAQCDSPRTHAPKESSEEDSEEEDPMARLTPYERENEILLRKIDVAAQELYIEYTTRGGFGEEVLEELEFHELVAENLFERRKSQPSLQDIEKVVKRAEENKGVATEVPPTDDKEFLKWAQKEICGHSWDLAHELNRYVGYGMFGRIRAGKMALAITVLRKHLDHLARWAAQLQGMWKEMAKSGDQMSGVAWKLDDVSRDLDEHREAWRVRVEAFEKSNA